MQKSIQQRFQRSWRWLNLNGFFRTMLGGTWMKNMLWCFHCPVYVQFYLDTFKATNCNNFYRINLVIRNTRRPVLTSPDLMGMMIWQ